MSKKDISKDKNSKKFGKELKAELKKVTWPTLKKLTTDTVAVITIVVVVAVIVFVLDVCFENLNSLSVGKIKTIVSTDTEENDEANGEEESEVSEYEDTEESDAVVESSDMVEETVETDTNSEAEVVE